MTDEELLNPVGGEVMVKFFYILTAEKRTLLHGTAVYERKTFTGNFEIPQDSVHGDASHTEIYEALITNACIEMNVESNEELAVLYYFCARNSV